MDLALANSPPTQSRAQNLAHFVAFLLAGVRMALDFLITDRVDSLVFVPAVWMTLDMMAIFAISLAWFFSNSSTFMRRWKNIMIIDLVIAAWYLYTTVEISAAATKGMPKSYDGEKTDLEWVYRRLGVFAAVSGFSCVFFIYEALVAAALPLSRWIDHLFPAPPLALAPVNIPLANLPPLFPHLQLDLPPRLPIPALPGRFRINLDHIENMV
ncbi:hypothetical protein VTL71DRAFT_5519 [Oculimacula yallundae]|uniref:Uncharacterized protein n=1 Tax=Oculimacula yallundae TaxID=86028 RepID=A0ABR4C1B9_9HELO